MEKQQTKIDFKALRAKRGWTQMDAANHFVVSLSTWCAWEQDRSYPKNKRLLQEIEKEAAK